MPRSDGGFRLVRLFRLRKFKSRGANHFTKVLLFDLSYYTTLLYLTLLSVTLQLFYQLP